MTNPETGSTVILGHEILDILAGMGGRASLQAFRTRVAAELGETAVFGNCHGDQFDFDGVVAFLASKGKLARAGDEVALGHVPGCSGH